MAEHESITDLQAVDLAFGKVIGDCYENLALEGSKAFQRFIQRKRKEKIFLVNNANVQNALHKYARFTDDSFVSENSVPPPDLPVIFYYREQGLKGDPNQPPRIHEAIRFQNENYIGGSDKAMRLTVLPMLLTYSVLFLAWDRATLDKMGLAWFGYIVPLWRKHSRFMVKYLFEGDLIEIPCNISTPHEILTDSEELNTNGVRLWGARTVVEITTQVLYGATVYMQDYFSVIGHFEVQP